MATPKLVLFDAYGTLFDVYSVSSTAEQIFPGHGSALSVLWRDKQIEYTRLRAMAVRGTQARFDGGAATSAAECVLKPGCVP